MCSHLTHQQPISNSSAASPAGASAFPRSSKRRACHPRRGGGRAPPVPEPSPCTATTIGCWAPPGSRTSPNWMSRRRSAPPPPPGWPTPRPTPTSSPHRSSPAPSSNRAAGHIGHHRRWVAAPRLGVCPTRMNPRTDRNTGEGYGPMQQPPSLSPETLAAQALGEVDPVSGGLTPAIHPSTNYEQQPDGAYRQDRVYTRADNPTYEPAEGLLAALEGAGCACALFASGMAAATAVFQALLPGDHVLVSRVLYWGVRKWLAEFALSWGLDVEFVDTTDLDALGSAIRPGRTRLLWVETPANPMWEITDLAAVCALAHAAGVRVVVDNTVATPVHTRPLELGADLVVHSATKYLNGHSDVLAGAVLTAHRDPLWERIRCGRCCIRGWRPIRATRSRRGRCAAGSAGCCRSGWWAERSRRWRCWAPCGCSSGPPRWAGWRA